MYAIQKGTHDALRTQFGDAALDRAKWSGSSLNDEQNTIAHTGYVLRIWQQTDWRGIDQNPAELIGGHGEDGRKPAGRQLGQWTRLITAPRGQDAQVRRDFDIWNRIAVATKEIRKANPDGQSEHVMYRRPAEVCINQ